MTELDNILNEIRAVKNAVIRMIETIRISGGQVVVSCLSEISGSLGLVKAGEFRSGLGEPGDAGDPFSGVRIGYPGFVYGGTNWNIVGVDADTLQFGIRSCDGKGVFGGGNAFIGADGQIFASTTYNTVSNSVGIRWVDPDDGNKIGARVGSYVNTAKTTTWLELYSGMYTPASDLYNNAGVEISAWANNGAGTLGEYTVYYLWANGIADSDEIIEELYATGVTARKTTWKFHLGIGEEFVAGYKHFMDINSSACPTTNSPPSSGIYLWAQGGALKAMASDGVIRSLW